MKSFNSQLDKSLAELGWIMCSSDNNQHPSLCDFYSDMYGYSPIGQPEILYEYLTDDKRTDHFELFAADELSIPLFLDEILNTSGMIFPGTFVTIDARNKPYISNKLKLLRSVNAICIDVDPVDHNDYVDVLALVECINHQHRILRPNYIVLSGHGLHLYFVFSSPVQSFGVLSNRRYALNTLQGALYTCYQDLLCNMGVDIDNQSCSLNHGFRAPGSLSKLGHTINCFTSITYQELCNPSELFIYLTKQGYIHEDKPRRLLDKSCLNWLDYAQIAHTKASDAQVSFIASLYEKHRVSQKDYDQSLSGDMSARDARIIISKALAHTPSVFLSNARDYSRWQIKPHRLRAGASGGIYKTVLSSLSKTKPGRRYMSMFMLAGVAYAMYDPPVSLKQLETDLMNLLETSWARGSNGIAPLTAKDVNNAIKGYCAENYRSRKSIVSTLGFDPFNPPAKRNGRTREEHLSLIAENKRETSFSSLEGALRKNPSLSKKKAAELSGLSYATVSKYWDDVCNSLSINPKRTRGRPGKNA